MRKKVWEREGKQGPGRGGILGKEGGLKVGCAKESTGGPEGGHKLFNVPSKPSMGKRKRRSKRRVAGEPVE